MKARRLAAYLAMIVGLLVATAMPAGADEPDGYTPDGMGGLFSTPSLEAGLQPTLFEATTSEDWALDFIPNSGWHVADNAFKRFFNGLANLNMWGTQALTRAAISLSWNVSDQSAYQSITNDLAKPFSGTANAVHGWLLPSLMGIGAVAFLISLGGRKGKALQQGLTMITVGVLAISMSTHPGYWTGAVNGTRDIGQDIASTMAVEATENATVPFSGPQATTNPATPTTNAMRHNADTIWRTFVASPWCLAEFGSLDACQKYGWNVVGQKDGASESSGTRYEYIYNTFSENVGGTDTAAWQFTAGHYPIQRVVITLFALLAAAVFTLLMAILALSSMAFGIMSIFLLYLGPILLPFAIIPGMPRSWARNWLALLVGFTLTGVGVLLIQSAALSVSVAVIKLSNTHGWFVTVTLNLMTVLAALLLLPHVRSIFGAPPTGALSAFTRMTGAAMAMRAISGRGKGAARTQGAGRNNRPAQPKGGSGNSGGSPKTGPAGPHMAKPNPTPAPKRHQQSRPHHTPPRPSQPKGGGMTPRRTRPTGAHTRQSSGPSPTRRPSRSSGTTPRTSRSYSRGGNPHLRKGASTPKRGGKRPGKRS